MRNLDKKERSDLKIQIKAQREAAKQIVRPEMPECVGSQLMKLHNGDEI